MPTRGFLGCLAGALAVCTLFQQSLAQQCYYPAGNSSPDVPCNSNGTASACCNQDAFCLGNGLCYVDGVISRGSCTDKSWQSSSCPIPCSQYATNIGVVVVNCNASTDAFVCAGQTCDDEGSLFTMRDANSFVFNNSDNELVTLTPGAVVNAISSGATSSTASGSQTPSASSSASSSATNTAASGAMYTAGDMAGVGVGIGIPLLLALLGALFVIRKQKKRLDGLSAQSTAAPSPAPDYSKAGYGQYHTQEGYAQTPLMSGQHIAQTNPVAYGIPPQYHQEMDTGPRVNELSDRPERQELDTTK